MCKGKREQKSFFLKITQVSRTLKREEEGGGAVDGGILICFESYSIKFAQQQYSRNREIKQQRLSFRDEIKKVPI